MATEKREYKGGTARTTLSSGISAGASSFVVASGTNYPTGGANGPFSITIDRDLPSEEVIKIASRSGNTFTVATRGFDGTVASSHGAGATIEHTLTASDIAQLNAHATDTTHDDHTQYLLRTDAYGFGTLADRPASGNLAENYFATDVDTNGGWYRWNGSSWDRTSPSPWTTWSPTTILADGSGGTTTGISYSGSSSSFLHRRLPGNQVEIDISITVQLTGTQKFTGISYSVPIAPVRTRDVQGNASSDVAKATVAAWGGTYGNAVLVFPLLAFPGTVAGQWNIPSTFPVRIHGTYNV